MEIIFDKYLSVDTWSIILTKLPDNDCYYIIGRWELINETCKYAIENKFYDLLKYAHGDGNIWNKYTCTAIDNGCCKNYVEDAMKLAEKSGNLQILLNTRKKKTSWKNICKYVIRYKELKQIYCPEDHEIKNFSDKC